jgi:hypothetical protein
MSDVVNTVIFGCFFWLKLKLFSFLLRVILTLNSRPLIFSYPRMTAALSKQIILFLVTSHSCTKPKALNVQLSQNDCCSEYTNNYVS